MKPNLDNQAGYTLMELLIGMVITSIIIMTVTSVSFLLFSSNLRVKQTDILEQTKYDLQNELSNSVRWAKLVTIDSGGDGFSVTSSEGTSTSYQFRNKQILKNGQNIIPEEVEITDMTVANYSAANDLVSLDIHVNLEQKVYKAVTNTARIVVSQRRLDIQN